MLRIILRIFLDFLGLFTANSPCVNSLLIHYVFIIFDTYLEYPKCCVFDLIRIRSVYPGGMDP